MHHAVQDDGKLAAHVRRREAVEGLGADGVEADGHIGLAEAIADLDAGVGEVVPGEGGLFLHHDGGAA